MKSQKKARLIGCGPVFLAVLIAALQVEVWAEGQKKQWVLFHDRVPEGSTRYSIALRYVPSESTFYNASRGDIQSVALPDSEQKEGYKERIDFGTALDGYRYSALLRAAREFRLINRDGRQIHRIQIRRSNENNKSEIIREGYFFPGSQIQIPFEVPGQQLALPTTESVPGTFSINIYNDNRYSYRGSFSTNLKGSLTGSTFIEGANLEVSVSSKRSLRPNDRHVQLAVQPIDEKLPHDSTSAKITDVLKLRLAKLVVEKIASDSSEIVLAVIHGDLRRTLKEGSRLSVGKLVPAFARMDLNRRQFLTLDELRKKAGREGYIVLIFGDLKREPLDYHYRNQRTNELALDETIVLEILQRDLKTPPVVVFVCRQFSLSDLYEKWLGRDPSFYIVADYSNPMNVWFWSSFRRERPHRRPPAKIETLREQFLLPENKVSILLVNGQGNLVYIKVDTERQLAESLTEINRLMRDNKRMKK